MKRTLTFPKGGGAAPAPGGGSTNRHTVDFLAVVDRTHCPDVDAGGQPSPE